MFGQTWFSLERASVREHSRSASTAQGAKSNSEGQTKDIFLKPGFSWRVTQGGMIWATFPLHFDKELKLSGLGLDFLISGHAFA